MTLISKREAILRQINGAIEHMHKGEFECAITLASAAEGQSAYQYDQVLFAQLQARVPPEFKDGKEWIAALNAVRDWLKHPTPQLDDEMNVAEFDAVTMILRAVSKFQHEHRKSTPRIEGFLDWCRENGYPGRPAKH